MARMLVLLVLLVLAAGVLAGAARASDDDVRVRGTCTGASTIRLRVGEHDGRLRAEVELRSARAARWRLVLLHERRLVARVALSAPVRGATVRLRRSVADWFGTDTLTVRASRLGETCRASATL